MIKWYSSRVEWLLAHWMPFYLDRSLRPLLVSSQCWRPECRTLSPPEGSQYTQPPEVSVMNRVWWWRSAFCNPRKSVVVRPFSEQILSVPPITFAQIRWTFAIAFCWSPPLQNFDILAPPGRVQSELVEYSQALAWCTVSQCSPVLWVGLTWSGILCACPRIVCNYLLIRQTVLLLISNLAWAFHRLVTLLPCDVTSTFLCQRTVWNAPLLLCPVQTLRGYPQLRSQVVAYQAFAL